MTRSPPWSDAENTAGVALYFRMLDKAQAGQPYNKAHMIREARGWRDGLPHDDGALFNRSRGSIEAKLMNMSAAHAAIGDGIAGRVTVTMAGFGYVPLANMQAALRDAMREAITERRASAPAFDDQAWCDAG